MSKDKKEVAKEAGSGKDMIAVANQIKETMKDFYKQESESTIDLQNMIKDRGFSHLEMDCEESETVVKIEKAQKVVDIYRRNLTDLLKGAPELNKHVQEFFAMWQDIKKHRFVKKEILFDMNKMNKACFMGVYMKRGNTELYLCYKVCKNAFKLAPDIYVVHQSESESAFWGAFNSSSKRDVLVDMNRGFTSQDLATLMEMCSFAVLDLEAIEAVE